LKKCLKTGGISSIRGGFASGKTGLVPCLVSMLLELAPLIKQKKVEEAAKN
jgi:hypothetical protein